ncbi:MAG: glutamine-hydrolyzing GMP synthase, partial [Rhodospirillales bacterium]|nr:glutamine-hydrolyzing GMP synthase [Rhodospirillales bacterium]
MAKSRTDRRTAPPRADPHSERVLIVDFGSQVTQLIARRVRESGVYSEIHPYDRVDDAFLKSFQPKAVILSGGPASVHQAGTPRAPDALWTLGVPVLGICYGQMAMQAQLGGHVEAGATREFGRASLRVTGASKLFAGLWKKGARPSVWMSHGDRVIEPAPGFKPVATSKGAPFAVLADDKRRFYGVMFHPEVHHTPDGAKLLENFTHQVAGCDGSWSMKAFKEDAIKRIRKQVGKGRVICGLSGGVDSSVVAALLHEAIDDQLTCVFVDTGLLRQGEAKQVADVFRGHYNIPLISRDASELFLRKLAGVEDPEEKRKMIGATFIDVFEQEARKVGDAEFLAQGTLYPDVIESVSFAGGP